MLHIAIICLSSLYLPFCDIVFIDFVLKFGPPPTPMLPPRWVAVASHLGDTGKTPAFSLLTQGKVWDLLLIPVGPPLKAAAPNVRDFQYPICPPVDQEDIYRASVWLLKKDPLFNSLSLLSTMASWDLWLAALISSFISHMFSFGWRYDEKGWRKGEGPEWVNRSF